MAEDIAPALLKDVERRFRQNLTRKGVNLRKDIQRARDGTLTNVHSFSNKVGDALAEAFGSITAEDLPEGTMFYNIADRVMRPPIKEAYVMVSDVADEVQTRANRKAGIGLKSIRPPIEEDRVKGLIDAVTSAEFEKTEHFLDYPVQCLVDHFADHHMEKNAEFLDNSGIYTEVIRTAEATCCPWCSDRAGTYDGYRAAQENEAFARHDGCRCTVEIRSGKTRGFMRKTSGHAFVRE